MGRPDKTAGRRRNRGIMSAIGAVPSAAVVDHPPRPLPHGAPAPSSVRERFQLVGAVTLSDLEMEVDEPYAARSQASSPAAPPSERPGAERTGSGRRVRQSLFYSSRPRHRRPSRHVEHPSALSSTEVEVTDLPTTEALSARDSAGIRSGHPGAEEAVSRTRVRQSVLYSDRLRRPRHRQVPLQTEEHPSKGNSSEFGGPVTDLPTLEALSLSDPPPLTRQISGEEYSYTDDDDESSHLYGHEDAGYSMISPNGVTRKMGPIGPTREMLLSPGDSLFLSMEEVEARKPKPRVNLEELGRMIKEFRDTYPPISIDETLRRIAAFENAELTALAAEMGVEPPRNQFLVDQEAASLQGQQQDPAAAAHPEDSMAISHEASAGVKDGKKWMRDEVTLCFRKHVEKTPDLAGLTFELDELCHQCFNVESYRKVFHHYNFKIKRKMPASDEWTVELYFGEVKEIFGRKFYFCCSLEPNESGHCHACKKQGVEDLKHPVTGGFETGMPDVFLYGDGPDVFWFRDGDE